MVLYKALTEQVYILLYPGIRKRRVHIQPLGGGLRAIVPAPSGILAVGEGAVLVGDLVGDLVLADRSGEAGEDGDMGFILSPLKGMGGGG